MKSASFVQRIATFRKTLWSRQGYHHSSWVSHSDRDYFEVLGAPRSFLLDQEDLKQKYRTLMAKYHPDKRQHNDPNLEEKASLVTHAYDTLKRPHTRATHLLKLAGHPLLETDNSGQVVGMEFLMHMMDVRDQVEHTNADEQLRELWQTNTREIETTSIQLDQAFHNNNIQECRKLVAILQYLNRIEETIREKMEYFE